MATPETASPGEFSSPSGGNGGVLETLQLSLSAEARVDKDVKAAVVEVEKLSKPATDGVMAQVGMISANGDLTIGRILAMKRVGKDGVITVEESKTMVTES